MSTSALPSEPFLLLDTANVPGLLDWIGFILGAAGLGFTVHQLLKSRNALQAAAKALEETRANLIKNQLVSQLPVFGVMAETITNSVRNNTPEAAITALNEFRLRAYEVHVLLRETDAGAEDLLDEIKACGDAAGSARAKLFDNLSETVKDRIGSEADKIQLLIPQISAAAVTVKYNLEKKNA